MGVKFSDKTLLNKRYISEINVHENESNDFRGIMDNIRLFIEQTVRRGNCISLNDIDYSISEGSFWDIEFFEDYCQNIFFTFKKGFTLKLSRKIEQLNRVDISYFFTTLSSNFTPYQNVFRSNANSYQSFIGRKLKNLSRDGTMDEVTQLDKENRNQLLHALKKALNKRQDKPIPTNKRPKEEYDHLPFTKMLRPTDKSKFRTREVIRDYLLQAGIPFEFFSKKPVKQTGKNHNPDGFKGAVAAMIHAFRELDYFASGLTFQEIIDAYLEETGNKIGKLSYFKRHFLEDNYFNQYRNQLKDILPKRLE